MRPIVSAYGWGGRGEGEGRDPEMARFINVYCPNAVHQEKLSHLGKGKQVPKTHIKLYSINSQEKICCYLTLHLEAEKFY
jgi:hypothetical protein